MNTECHRCNGKGTIDVPDHNPHYTTYGVTVYPCPNKNCAAGARKREWDRNSGPSD